MADKSLSRLTRDELYERAQDADIPGRSKMGKRELVEALSKPSAGPGERSATAKRSIWSGAINFGLISIPVGLYSATEDRDISFHLLSSKDKSRIEYKRVSAKTGREVDWDDIVKGYEYEDGKYVVITPDELDEIAPASAKVIDVVQFVEATEIDPIYFEKTYFVAPTEVAVKAYALFTRAMAESDLIAVGKVAIRDKERLCTLRVRDDMIVLETMNWPDEIRQPSFEQLSGTPPMSADEIEMARIRSGELRGHVPSAARGCDRGQDRRRRSLGRSRRRSQRTSHGSPRCPQGKCGEDAKVRLIAGPATGLAALGRSPFERGTTCAQCALMLRPEPAAAAWWSGR